jgi:hypothetical protein
LIAGDWNLFRKSANRLYWIWKVTRIWFHHFNQTYKNILNRFLLKGNNNNLMVICVLVGGQIGPKICWTARNLIFFIIRYRYRYYQLHSRQHAPSCLSPHDRRILIVCSSDLRPGCGLAVGHHVCSQLCCPLIAGALPLKSLPDSREILKS